MYVSDNLRFRQSVGVVVKENSIEFFRANIRQSLILKMKFNKIIEFLNYFDGKTSIEKIHKKYENVDYNQLLELIFFLKNEYILIEQNVAYPYSLIENNYRLINLLEDYFHSTEEVVEAIEKLRQSKVMIIGVGAVGSFIATYLAKSNVRKFVIIDDDVVDISNLHRQYYFEKDVGCKKGEKLKDRLRKINKSIEVEVISKKLDENFFKNNKIDSNISLIINCADQPSVDFTSKIVARYAMEYNIPHIVGGGYNLHLTLIGQTIIPNLTACFKCFQKALYEKNIKDLHGVKKLHREARKLGSYSPLSGIASNLAALDAFKVLIGSYSTLQQANRRIEFNIRNNDFDIREITPNLNCEWCRGNYYE